MELAFRPMTADEIELNRLYLEIDVKDSINLEGKPFSVELTDGTKLNSIHFDPSNIPDEAVVTSATLIFHKHRII